jgi:hypothetical protein
MWLVDADFTFSTTFPLEATAMLTDLAEARPMSQTEMNVKTPYSTHQTSGLVDSAATFAEFVVSKDFVRRFSLSTRKFKATTLIQLANG